MQARPFVLVGDSALAALRVRVAAALEAWRVGWAVYAGSAVRDCSRAIDAPLDEGWHAWQAGGHTLARVRLPHPAAWCDALFGPSVECAPRADSVAMQLAAAARDDLLVEVAAAIRGTRCEGTLVLAPLDGALFRPGAGSVQLSLAVGACAMDWLVAHGEMQAGMEARAASSAPTPLDRGAALRALPVTLQAEVGHIEIDAAALHALVPGDVIRLGSRLEQPLAVVAPDGAVLFRGHLGTSHGARALDLVP